ncbi:MAG: hypothetical protein ACFFD2_22615 [Promethearchaeota archaeon]
MNYYWFLFVIGPWTCQCGVTHNRDVNAATNLKREGIHRLEDQGLKIISAVGTPGNNASGDHVRPASVGSDQGTSKRPIFG